MTQQLAMDLQYDLKALIREEHRRAELLRLRLGIDSCGCTECEALYQTLDVSKYGGQAGKQAKDFWSDDGQVFFTDGRGYGVAPNGSTVDIGKQSDILEAFASGKISKHLCPNGAEVLQQILDYREDKGYGYQPKTDRASDFRSRPAGHFKHREAPAQRLAAPKRTTLREAKQKK